MHATLIFALYSDSTIDNSVSLITDGYSIIGNNNGDYQGNYPWLGVDSGQQYEIQNYGNPSLQ